MNRVRIGNDVRIEWEILRNGIPENFEGKNISLKLVNIYEVPQEITYTQKDNVFTIDFFGKDQQNEGVYALILIENEGKPNMATIDYVKAFQLVKHTFQESEDTGCPTLKTVKVPLVSQIKSFGNKVNVIDNLDSTSVKDALSANQGNILKGKINQVAKKIPLKVSQLSNDSNFTEKEYVDEVNRIQNGKILTLSKENESQSAQIDQLLKEIVTLVKKRDGYDLSQNDFNDSLKAKLEGLEKYDDTLVNRRIDSLKRSLDELIGTSVTEAIDNFNEVEEFLKGFNDKESLSSVLKSLQDNSVGEKNNNNGIALNGIPAKYAVGRKSCILGGVGVGQIAYRALDVSKVDKNGVQIFTNRRFEIGLKVAIRKTPFLRDPDYVGIVHNIDPSDVEQKNPYIFPEFPFEAGKFWIDYPSGAALGEYSLVSGYGNYTENYAENAFGKWNYPVRGTSPDGSIFTIGIGFQGGQKNALLVKADGSIFVLGLGGYAGRDYEESIPLQKVIEDIDGNKQIKEDDGESPISMESNTYYVIKQKPANGIITINGFESPSTTVVKTYILQFYSGEPAVKLNVPESVKFVGGTPNILPNKTYIITFTNNIARVEYVDGML